jgi:hypothetical protein
MYQEKLYVSDPDVCFFLTCSENPFFILDTHKNPAGGICCLLKEVTFSERRSLFHGGEFPIHSGPLLKVNCPCTLAFPSPHAPASTHRAFISLDKDDINKPDSLVGHSSIHSWALTD